MKRHFTLSGAVLGTLVAALAGCGDEGAANDTQETKSAITARGFAGSGCSGSGIFDITSNNAINFVALDNSSFSKLNAQLFSLDKNNVETLISDSQKSNAVDQSMTSLFDQVTNFTSAKQRASQLAEQRARTEQKSESENTLNSNEIASTSTTTKSTRDASNKQFSSNSASGFNNTRSSNDAHNSADSQNKASASNSSRSNQSSAAEQAAKNEADSAQKSRAHNDASNSANSNANNSASNSGSNAFDTVAKGQDGKVGFGAGGFGFNDIANLSSFSNNVFNDLRSSRSNNQRSDVNNNAFAEAENNSFSKVFQNSRRNASNNVNSSDRASTQSNVHNDANSKNSFDRNDTINLETKSHDQLETADSATTKNSLFKKTSATSDNVFDTNSKLESNNNSDQSAESNNRSTAKNEANSQRYTALSNLSQFNSKNLVLRVNVTSNTQSAIVRVFTGNNANNVAANQDFSQTFAGCGASVIIPKKSTTVLAPAAADEGEAVLLGDRVAKPE